MANAFHVVVPSPGRRTMGLLRLATSARGGVLLLEDASACSSLPHAIYAEVGLYLHAAGFNTLSVSLPVDADLGTRASRIVGGVGMLRSLNRDKKIVLVTLAPPRTVSRAEASAASLAILLDQATREARSLPDIISVVRDLSVTIRDVAESVVGVAALVAPPQPSGADTARTHRRAPHTHPVAARPDGAGGGTSVTSVTSVMREPAEPGGPASLVLSLPAANDAASMARVVAQAVSQLYVWTLSLTRAGASLAALARPEPLPLSRLPVWMVIRQEQVAALRADWHARLRWADVQWVALLANATDSDPVRGALARQACVAAGRDYGYSVRGARLAWRHLTGEERQTWLQVCSALYQ